MFVVLLKFSEHKAKAPQYMDGHNQWIQQAMDDGVFVLAGSLQPALGGALIAHGMDHDALVARLEQDPFVQEAVVAYEILEISPARVDERLGFLLD